MQWIVSVLQAGAGLEQSCPGRACARASVLAGLCQGSAGWGVTFPSPKMTWLIASLQRCSSSSHKGGCLGLGSLQLLDIFWGPPQTSGNVRDGRGFFFLFTGEALGRGGTILRSYTELVVKVEARASCMRESRAFSTGSFLGLGMSCAANVAPSPFVGRGCFPETRAGRLCAKSE